MPQLKVTSWYNSHYKPTYIILSVGGSSPGYTQNQASSLKKVYQSQMLLKIEGFIANRSAKNQIKLLLVYLTFGVKELQA